MSAAPILREVYTAYLKHWGKPSGAMEFAAKPDADGLKLATLDVFVWEAAAADEITVLATIGMSAVAMRGAAHRAELHMSVLGLLDAESIKQVAEYLVNLSHYPFDHDTHLDWWHKMNDTGAIPQFPGFRSVLLHPKFFDSGLDEISTSEGLVKILNVIPLSADEAQKEPSDLLQYFQDREIDPFSNARCAVPASEADQASPDGASRG